MSLQNHEKSFFHFSVGLCDVIARMRADLARAKRDTFTDSKRNANNFEYSNSNTSNFEYSNAKRDTNAANPGFGRARFAGDGGL